MHAFLFGIRKHEESKERILPPSDPESMDISDEELPLKRKKMSDSMSVDTLNDPVQAKRAKKSESSYLLEG